MSAIYNCIYITLQYIYIYIYIYGLRVKLYNSFIEGPGFLCFYNYNSSNKLYCNKLYILTHMSTFYAHT